ncbi:MAG: hypothetical protein OEY81_03470 [Candidatus Bathyarchaeota archaeon]|nr:hypothetical protein [Candidatus Bathyarchaeota archaeon]
MKLEKKLIACSILALIIGVSSVFPLVFLMSATAKAEASSEPWFSVDMPYAYWVTYDGPLKDSPYQFPGFSEMNETNSVSDQLLMALNFTLTADTTQQQADAQLEYYQIDLNSDKEFIESHYWLIGTNIDSSFNVSSLLTNFHFVQNEWFDTDTFNPMKGGGGGGLVRPNWASGDSILWPAGGSGSGTIGGSSTYSTVSALRAAETITISVYRIGFVTFSWNTTVVTLSNNELISQIQLEKYGEEGWLYNNLVPEDELATVDLLRPVSFEELNSRP